MPSLQKQWQSGQIGTSAHVTEQSGHRGVPDQRIRAVPTDLVSSEIAVLTRACILPKNLSKMNTKVYVYQVM